MNPPHRCWICGAEADSAEHMVKASDVRSLFGHITQRAPVYRHAAREYNVRVNGADAAPLKFKPSICAHCNNARTQPHDRAWERLSLALRSEVGPLHRNLKVDLASVFGQDYESPMAGVHFFFLKLLGCYGVEYGVPLPMHSLAVSILSGVAHPQVFITFCSVHQKDGGAVVQVGELTGVHRGRHLVGATWYYIVGPVGVLVAYTEQGRPGKGFSWHPDDHASQLCIA